MSARSPRPQQAPLFLLDDEPPPVRSTGDDRSWRRALTLRQLELLRAGAHPVTGRPLHREAAPVDERTAPGLRCGGCALLYTDHRGYPKCRKARATRGAATDIRQWWPECTSYQGRDAPAVAPTPAAASGS